MSAEFACLLTGGPEFKIRVRGKTFVFEFPTYYGGPAALTKRGDIARAQPTYFLEAASLWHKQGRRMTADGYCIWTPKPKQILKHLGGRHHKLIGEEIQADCS